VGVLGDLILDEFIWGRVDRISPEAPVPVVEVTRESESLGGAANVAANIVALGGRAELVGLVGDDAEGDRLLKQLAAREIGITGVIRWPGRRTTTKSRLIAHHQQVCRFDRESRAPLPESLADRLRQEAAEAASRTLAFVISDYAKGVVTPSVVSALIKSTRRLGRLVAVDPKQRDLALYYRGAELVTPNQKEAAQAAGIDIADDSSLEMAAAFVKQATHARYALITRGEEGMSLYDGNGLRHFKAAAREVFDVTGAGDTVIATLTLALASGAPIDDAVILANLAAGIVVGKVGTAVPTPEELLSAIDETEGPHPGFQPDRGR
jgi:D-glycero-beta-D-manno-heptose-7-phosphate kinase